MIKVHAASPAGPPGPNVDELLSGTPYRRVELIGRGGMGEVHLVEHRTMGRRFALKILHRRFVEDAQAADRMRVEAQSLARLQHPNVVDVIDYWIADDGRPCVVMERLQGRPLSQELRSRKKIPLVESLTLARQALRALGAAHGLGIVHRDIKPENLFLHDAPVEGRVLKVLDFGLARVLPTASALAPSRLAVSTALGAVVGSPRFLSPEAARGERVDHRADIFSLAAVLYLMLSGRGPFDTGAAEPDPPSRHAEGIPALLDASVIRALSFSPSDRHQSVEEFASDLRAVARSAK